MPKAQKVERTEYKFPDDEYYPCVLDSVTEKEVTFFKKDKATGQKTNEQDSFLKWVWKFEITGGPFMGDNLYAETSAEYSTREDNKIRQFAEALLGREQEVGEEIDTDLMVGLPCIVTVRHDEPRPKADGTNFYPCAVDEVFPKGGAASAPVAGRGGQAAFNDEPPF